MDPAELQAESDDAVLKSADMHLKGFREESREVDFVCSTDDVDRDGDVLEQDWVLEPYRRNPVLLWAHNNRELPIGHAVKCDVEGGKLVATFKIASEKANPLAERVLQSIKEKTLRAVSVGFRPKNVRVERRDDREVYVLGQNELHEVSVVPVPSNREALMRHFKSLKTEAKEKIQPSPGTVKAGQPAGNNGSPMDFETMKKEFDAKLKETEASFDKKLASAREGFDKTLADERSKSDALKGRVDSLETELTASRKHAKELESAAVSKQLDELVGKKISPAEKPGLMKLAEVARETFDEQLKAIKGRPDMGLLKDAVPNADPAPNSLPSAGADNGAEFESMGG